MTITNRDLNECDVLLLNGPNLNLLGTREPEIYGSETLESIETRLVATAKSNNCTLKALQSNSESDLVGYIQASNRTNIKFLIINAAALTHTSVAIRDAIIAVDVPFIEVHLSNIYKREQFRHHSYLSDKAEAVICGLGSYGYDAALAHVLRKLGGA